MICLFTRSTLPLPHPEMIPSLLPLTIRCWYLCLATLMPDLILAGRSRRHKGVPCSSVSSRENHSVTSHLIMAYRMSQSGECCGRRGAKWDESTRISRNRQDSTRRLHKQSMDEASPTHVPGASGTLAVYHSRVQHTREAPGLQTGARREADAPHGALNCIIDREKDAGVVASCFRNGWCKLRNQHIVTSPH